MYDYMIRQWFGDSSKQLCDYVRMEARVVLYGLM